MSGLTDLQASISKLSTSVDNATAKIAEGGAIDGTLGDLAKQLDTISAKLDAAVNPAPPAG